MPWGLLLVNLGTPEAAETGAVRRYLREFLSDPRVLDTPWLSRVLLLYLVILPFRSPRSAAAYRKIWTERGSPLRLHGRDLVVKLRAAAFRDIPVELAMRYQTPTIASALERLAASGCGEILVFPLFPQYSSAAWGSAVEKVYKEAGRLQNVPAIHVIPPFYDHDAFLEAFAEIARPVLRELRPEKVVMSFHGLPVRQIQKSDPSGTYCLRTDTCCHRVEDANRHCYRAHCFATARGIAERLGLGQAEYEVAFQSRLGRTPWIRPYTDHLIRELAGRGIKRVAVLCPAFVADCLETLEEIEIRAKDDFLVHGGEELRLVPSLNSGEAWVRTVLQIVEENLPRRSDATSRA